MVLDLNALKTEITTDPESLGYTGDNKEDAVIINNGILRQVPRSIAMVTLRNFLANETDGVAANKRWTLDMIKEYSKAGTVRGVVGGENRPLSRKSAATMIWIMLKTEGEFSIGDTEISKAFTDIGPDGGNGPTVLTAPQIATINALTLDNGSRAVELFGQGVTISNIAVARALP